MRRLKISQRTVELPVKHLLLRILDFLFPKKLLFTEINMAKNIVLLASKITYHLARRLICFVVCCDTALQQKHRRQRQQGHHRDFM